MRKEEYFLTCGKCGGQAKYCYNGRGRHFLMCLGNCGWGREIHYDH